MFWVDFYCLFCRVWFQQNEPKIIIVWNNYERAAEIVKRSTLYTFSVSFHATEAVVQRCSVKKVFLEISQNWQENTCAWVSFLIKLQGSGLFLWILWNFLEHLFYRTPLVAASDATLNGFGCRYCSCMFFLPNKFPIFHFR